MREVTDVAETAAGSPPAAVSLIDLHTHSSERSLDSGIRALALARRARDVGLSGICLTDHNAICDPHEARRLEEQSGVTVIPAMEVGTDIGHVLVYGLDRFRPELIHLDKLRRIVLTEGAVMIWAHPMRDMRLPRPDWDRLTELFDGLEVVNGDHIDRPDDYYAGLAGQLGLARTAGSDAHSLQAVGRVGTRFDVPIRGLADLITALQQRVAEPLVLTD